MHVYAAVAALAVALWTGAGASPLYACNEVENTFVADDVSLCVFHQCSFGRAVKFSCAKGSRVPSYFTKGPSDPCIVRLKKNVLAACDRCNVTDDPIPGAKNSNQCAQFRPCDARPGCTCVDQVAGYYCSCPQTATAIVPTLSRTAVQQCDVNVCKNGGSCYSLYKNKFCNCVPPYTGKYCEADACDSLICNNGYCEYDAFGVFCRCEQCYTGPCCEDKIVNCTSSCGDCRGGPNCTIPFTWLCTCNPCKSPEEICANSSRYSRTKTVDCSRGAATAGNRFTLMFEQNFPSTGDNNSALEVYIAAGEEDNKTRFVNVSTPRALPGCKFSTTASVVGGSVTKVSVPLQCRHDNTGLRNNGILVQELNNETVTVYAINRATFSADSFLALPDRRAGQQFVVICYATINNQNVTDHQTQLGIVATEDGTQVNVTLSTPTDIPGSVNDTTYIISLDAFQTYQIQASQPGADLSGTIIVSSKPIHVVSGNMRTSVIVDRNVSTLTLSTDHLVEEIPPAETWGKQFAIVPIPRDELGYAKTLEQIRLVASFDTTCIVYNSTGRARTISISTERDWFIKFTLDASDNYFLDCSDPVLIMELTASADETKGDAQGRRLNDPAMIYVPSISQYTNYYIFTPPQYSNGGPYNTTLAVLAANLTTYQQIQVNNVLTAQLTPFKPWNRIAPTLNSPQLFGGIFRISNEATSIIKHPVKQVPFMCIIYCYHDRESIGHVAGSALSASNDLTSGTGLSQWEWVKTRNYSYV